MVFAMYFSHLFLFPKLIYNVVDWFGGITEFGTMFRRMFIECFQSIRAHLVMYRQLYFQVLPTVLQA